MKRMKYAGGVALLLLLIWLALPGCAANQVNAGVDIRQVILTWSGDPRTTQTINWKMVRAAGCVEYQPAALAAAGAPPQRVAAVEEAFRVDEENLQQYSAVLTPLVPATRYLYRIGDGAGWSEWHEFTTAALAPQSFSFLVFGDSQSSNYQVWAATLQAAYRQQPAAAFFVNVGDLVDVGQSQAEWRGWLQGTVGISERIPVLPVVGNHETYSPGAKFSLPSFFTGQFKLPDNGPEGLKEQVYSLDYGLVHIVVLDTQAGEEAAFIPDMLERQKAWLEQDLAATARSKWKLVFLHRPVFGNGAPHSSERIRAAFAPLFDKYQVNVVFSGHEHVYARTRAIQADGTDSATGVVYIATGRSGTKTYTTQTANVWDEVFYNPLAQPMFLTVAVQPQQLVVQAVNQNGTIIDSWTGYKP